MGYDTSNLGYSDRNMSLLWNLYVFYRLSSVFAFQDHTTSISVLLLSLIDTYNLLTHLCTHH